MKYDRRDERLIRKMLNEIAELESFIHGLDIVGFLGSSITQRAVAMTMINIGELSKKLSETTLQAMKNVPWGKIRGFRNLAAHQYDDIDMDEVWDIVTQDIPDFQATLITVQSKFKA